MKLLILTFSKNKTKNYASSKNSSTFNSASRMMARKVPLATVAWFGTVKGGFAGCLRWMWLPFYHVRGIQIFAAS